MGIEYLINSWYLAGGSVDRVEYLPRASIERLVWGWGICVGNREVLYS